MNRIYEQRIGIAVEAALSGRAVKFHLDGTSPVYLAWLEDGSKRHVISAGTRRAMEAMLPEVHAEFVRRLLDAGGISGPQGERRAAAALPAG